MRLRIIFIFFLLCGSLLARAGIINGHITNQSGEPLAFASVYIMGTTIGTASNPEGYFELELPDGAYELIFQYIGYKQHHENIFVGKELLSLNIVMEDEQVSLDEVVISADAEDPAYRIIRNAIRMRKYYLRQVDNYKCEAYTKGIFRITEAPDKIFGDSLNTKEDSILGIVYLSESESIISYEQPDKFKEEMISVKVSGNDQGFGFNFITFFMVNFYNNNIIIPVDASERGFISPIGSSALFYYRYRLEGTYFEEDYIVNKIKVIPKRKIDPVFGGYIYIIEDSWRIHSLNLMISKDANIDFIDSVKIAKSMVPVNDSIWMPLTQKLQFFFSINFFGKRFAGNGIFHSQFTDYLFNNEFERKYFGNEIVRANEDANKKDSLYWEENRPIPLTAEEQRNYLKEDSLQDLRSSKEYLDSLDRKRNKIKWGALLSGYSYYRRYDSTRYSINSPLTTVNFNTVQGVNLYLRTAFSKSFSNGNHFSIAQNVSYGFSNVRWGYDLNSRYFYNRNKSANIRVAGGIGPVQYNANNPISPFVNTFYTLLDGNNYMKLYEKSWVGVSHFSELINGIFFIAGVEYAGRSALVNTTNYSWVKSSKNRFTSNDPQNPLNEGPAFSWNKSFTIDLAFRIRIQQKYISIPNKSIIGSKYPDFVISYKKGIDGFLGSDVDYDLLKIGIEGRQKLGLLGTLQFKGTYGTFLNNRKMKFMDYKHFNGNRTIFAKYRLNSFQMLDYYSHSTNKNYVEVCAEHHFNGFIFNKLPLIRKAKWKAVGGFRYFTSEFTNNYFEVSAGIENIFTLFRVDFVAGYNAGKNVRTGIVIGMKMGN
ncbi:MAG: DUF5686 and carboxypeptidase regulatory-like domain-containing protein [Bacteroidales bacterium]|nr:DUF5686 and carboxypeptidase regulatory-like domain-containing protein [Bacteroidales bacterium]